MGGGGGIMRGIDSWNEARRHNHRDIHTTHTHTPTHTHRPGGEFALSSGVRHVSRSRRLCRLRCTRNLGESEGGRERKCGRACVCQRASISACRYSGPFGGNARKARRKWAPIHDESVWMHKTKAFQATQKFARADFKKHTFRWERLALGRAVSGTGSREGPAHWR